MNYPQAKDWMWNYCIYIGSDDTYDYGVYVDNQGEVSHAVVYSNEPGDYISGPMDRPWTQRPAIENLNRWITFQLDGL
jgi:hypothetical protein